MINYGIQNEESDLRAHVSVCNATVYLFTPENARKAIECHPEVHPKNAFQTGVSFATANGYPMPIKFINGLKSIKIPQYIFENACFLESDNTSIKGNKAVYIVKEMLKINLIPFAFNVDEITDRTMQIRGTDIIVSARYRIQIKCDWRIGETGNIYLQTQERNPLKRI
jgi:hypothetical protein